ncbi:hypothetical protein GCM10010365_74300 [Streptomyces poonensis]|uniref:Uncharacterized protein n=1 Tax=Streptomyces poonensis TaxID=68255 RepID=A0A918UXH1_9ACTN|nr:hypothetical protein GCM10010365_74300 [Streptomyces poonensis]
MSAAGDLPQSLLDVVAVETVRARVLGDGALHGERRLEPHGTLPLALRIVGQLLELAAFAVGGLLEGDQLTRQAGALRWGAGVLLACRCGCRDGGCRCCFPDLWRGLRRNQR